MPKVSTSKCLMSARMLVPKFAFEDDNGWHIQWPCDLPDVVHAPTQRKLVITLATKLYEIQRLGNQGPHVEAEYL